MNCQIVIYCQIISKPRTEDDLEFPISEGLITCNREYLNDIKENISEQGFRIINREAWGQLSKPVPNKPRQKCFRGGKTYKITDMQSYYIRPTSSNGKEQTLFAFTILY